MAYILSDEHKTFRFIMETATNLFRPGHNGVLACIPIPSGHENSARLMFAGGPLRISEKTVLESLMALKSDGLKSYNDLSAAFGSIATPEELELLKSEPLKFMLDFEILDFMGQSFAVNLERYAAATGLPKTAEKHRYVTVKLIETNGRTVAVVFDPALSGDVEDFPMDMFLELAQTRAGSGFDVGRGYLLPGGINLETLLDHPLFTEAIGVYPCGYAISLRRDGDDIYASI